MHQLDRRVYTFYNNTMKRSFHHFFILFFLLAALSVWAEPVLLEGTVDAETGLKQLYLAVNGGDPAEIDPETIFVLEGVVSAREVLQPAEMGYIGLLELTLGEWQGLESVIAYRCYVQFEGEQFAALIPQGRQRNPDPREVPLNARVLTFGRYLGYSEDADGRRFPVLLGEAVRVLN